jgi:hypothetical protein
MKPIGAEKQRQNKGEKEGEKEGQQKTEIQKRQISEYKEKNNIKRL